MSGFAPDWLKLREGTDHRARDKGLLQRLAAHFADRTEIRVMDLGAGLGSNLRGTFAALPARQHWILVDYDPALLAGACEAIAGWADNARPTASGVEAVKDGCSLHVELKRHDLAADPAPWGSDKPDLVTAAALFDLVSDAWIERFVAALARAKLAFYTVLTHDSTTEWLPAYPADAEMRAAFESHFGRDKGFGPAAGGRASGLIANALVKSGYTVERAPSPWKLGSKDKTLIAALAQGWADAVRETARVPEATIKAWLEARAADSVTCTVGHEDLLAFPPA
ncbi:MAG: class I SAM-dependent methyltransferase [Bradyrhizobiaceae bacterium]|nr:class I SAM-dependent methyltransferase [Bradyrhizobiaceae bacterium]